MWMICERNNEGSQKATAATLQSILATNPIKVILCDSYIGGARLCLASPETFGFDAFSTIQQLTFCQTIFNTNQTLAQTTRVNVAMTKVINRTESLTEGEQATYSGIWVPRVIHEHTSDQMTYNQVGSYILYLAPNQILRLDFKETPFFIVNTQESIARTGE
ncbi:unnamed protein product, partial [Rotaria sp. Silwood2]